MSQASLFGTPILEEAIQGERRDGAEHAIAPRIVGYVRTAPVVALSPYVICPATSIGSMDKEHVDRDGWEVPARRLAAAHKVGVILYRIETDGSWTPLGRMDRGGNVQP